MAQYCLPFLVSILVVFSNAGLLKDVSDPEEGVLVELFYECLCPHCIHEYPQVLEVHQKLSKYVKLHTFPFGNANMTQKDNDTVIVCQHGTDECYGNKLHACSNEYLGRRNVNNNNIDYNACMMQLRSNDLAADKCGNTLTVDSATVENIKTCAKGAQGHALMIAVGKYSKSKRFQHVPYILVNGQVVSNNNNQSLYEVVCKAFGHTVPECKVRV